MKKLFLTTALIAVVLISCSSAPQPAGITGLATLSDTGNVMTENELTGKEWRLTEVRINGVNTGFNRNDLNRTGLTLAEGFVLNFDSETISGMAAPNRYIAQYTRTGNQISISLIASTKMASIFNLDKLKEQDYFNYLQNTESWNFVNNNLELYSKTADGKAVVLIFIPIYPER
jgi:heat shock protein HslJ